MARKPNQIAKTLPKGAQASSVLADLESRTTTEAQRAPRQPGVRTGASVNFSGQYLYDRFVAGDKEEITKMDIVRQMVSAVDVGSFKAAIGEMVNIAKQQINKAIAEARQHGAYDEKNPPAPVASAQARFKTAQNHQTVMRIAFGAIKFAGDVLEKHGYDDQTGYQAMRVIGTKALAAKGIKWDGTKAEDPDKREERKQQAKEAAALREVMDDNPMKAGEKRAEYFDRCDKLVTKLLKEQAQQEHHDQLVKLAQQFRTNAGDMFPEVLDMLLTGKDLPAEPEIDPTMAMAQPAQAQPAAALH